MRQLLGAGQTSLRGIELRFPLRHCRFRSRVFGFALCDQAPCRLDTDLGSAQLRFGLFELAFKLVRIHACKDVICLYEIAFVDEDFADAPRTLR